MDESNVLDSGFLERMNTLLANGEVRREREGKEEKESECVKNDCGYYRRNWDSGNWVKLYNEKRQDLEEQQLHLSVGLQKIRETVEQVEELQASLSIKKNELEQRNTLVKADGS